MAISILEKDGQKIIDKAEGAVYRYVLDSESDLSDLPDGSTGTERERPRPGSEAYVTETGRTYILTVSREWVKKKVDQTENDFFIVPMIIEMYGVKVALKRFAEANAEHDTLTNICLRFFTAAAKVENRKFTSQFYKFATSQSTLGEKLDDNAELVCTPSTRATAGTDDYATIPLFSCFDVNYTIDGTTLEPVIHAIKDVYGSFTATPTTSLVGVMQMTGWVRRSSTETTKKVEYVANEESGFKPLPEAVRASDNSVRPFVIHAKYAGGYNAAGVLSSVSGSQPATFRSDSLGSTLISHDGQIDKWRELGSQYVGSSLCDIAFLQLMLEIKYATLGSSQVMSGCRSYDVNATAEVSESGVTRVLLTSENAAKFIEKSCVSLGTTADRSKADAYSVCDIVPILGVEDVEVDGVAYKAVNLGAETAFDVDTNTVIVSQPWRTGATDDVPGNDGSPFNNTSGKEPYKLQGIEVQLGMYEVPGDTALNETATADEVPGVYNIYANRLAANVRSGDSGVDPVLVGTIAKNGSAAWKYVAELNWDENDQEAYLSAKAFGAGSTTGYRGAMNLDAEATAGLREWLAFGALSVGASCGIVCARLLFGLGDASWYIGARACGTGGNRGEFVPAEPV